MVKDLGSVVFYILYRVEAKVNFSDQGKVFNEAQLAYFSDLVERKIEKP